MFDTVDKIDLSNIFDAFEEYTIAMMNWAATPDGHTKGVLWVTVEEKKAHYVAVKKSALRCL
jgi:hypothetical protein